MLTQVRRIFLVVLLFASAEAAGQTWPTKSLRVFNGYSPGASVDLTCRVALNALSTALGQPVVIENRPGNASILGAQAAARADADGYNFFCTATSAIVTNPLTFKKLPYDPEKDFVPVGLVGTNPFFILVNPQVPAKTLPELIALDKANPGALSFASDGTKNFTGLIGTWLNKLGGTQFVQVPYSTMAQGLQDTIAGRTQFIMQPAATARQFIANGQLRPIAVTSLRPAEGFESVPPVANTFPGFEFVGWVGLFAPTGTLDAVVQQLNRALGDAVKDAAVVQRLHALGMTPSDAATSAEMAAFVKAERERWGTLMREIRFEPD
jgi:tripartite-type tricarboxylate transporter receptor subunit TctC